MTSTRLAAHVRIGGVWRWKGSRHDINGTSSRVADVTIPVADGIETCIEVVCRVGWRWGAERGDRMHWTKVVVWLSWLKQDFLPPMVSSLEVSS